jgi:hypothetical protein
MKKSYDDSSYPDKIRNNALLLFAIFVIILLMAGACSAINSLLNLSDDNHIEEMVETAIEVQTGVDVDLTPNTEERK